MTLTARQCEQATIRICPMDAVDKHGNPLKHRGEPVPYFMVDADGLMLRVSECGAKSWVLRYRLDGKRHDMGLGKLSRYSLAEARDKARKLHREIDDGID